MAGKTKKQVLQELKESQKRIQELLREVDRLKKASSVYESNQNVIHNLRLQMEGQKYVIELFRTKNIRLKKEAQELQAQISAKNEEEKNQFIEEIKSERDKLDKEVRQMETKLKNSRDISFLNSLEGRCAALENDKKRLEEDKFFLEHRIKHLKHSLEERDNDIQELGKTMEKSSDYYIKTIRELQEENTKLYCGKAHNARGAGRKKRNAKYMERYRIFENLLKKGSSKKAIIETMGISQATFYRFLKEYRENLEND